MYMVYLCTHANVYILYVRMFSGVRVGHSYVRPPPIPAIKNGGNG